LSDRIGWLRAAVIGANDGIVSTASLIVGVAAADAAQNAVLIAQHTQIETNGDRLMKSALKRSVIIGGHKTSVSLEDEF
jgi:VIT1/CCC1 family predicted Fe2+/Mn2+ transporter